jgi:transposase
METTTQEALLFQAALGIQPPWKITNIILNQDKHELHIYLDFDKGSSFSCPTCHASCKCYDTKEKTWRHLSFFEYKTFLHARTPRVSCTEHGIHQIQVPWARPGSGFTLLFESMLLLLCKETTVKGVERIAKVRDTTIWNILEHYVGAAVQSIDSSNTTSIGLDETSRKRGHNYVTLAVDMKERKVFHVVEGRGKEACSSIAQALCTQNSSPYQIHSISMDMSPSYIKGCTQFFPLAAITFDKFHIMKLVNQAVDIVRREESKEQPALKRSRYLWLQNHDKLTQKQQERLAELRQNPYLETAKAYSLKLQFQEFWNCSAKEAECFLFEWIQHVHQTKLQPLLQVANTILNHWKGIVRWFESRVNNGVLEGINSVIQAAKRKARGYRTTKNLITMIYLLAGKINLDPILHLLPT